CGFSLSLSSRFEYIASYETDKVEDTKAPEIEQCDSSASSSSSCHCSPGCLYLLGPIRVNASKYRMSFAGLEEPCPKRLSAPSDNIDAPKSAREFCLINRRLE